MDSIIWAIKHTMRDIADIGLNCNALWLLISVACLTCYSVQRSCEQFRKCGRPGSYKLFLPAVLFKYRSRHVLCVDGHGP